VRLREAYDELLTDEVELAMLPPQIRLLVNACGLEAAFSLLRARGGAPYTVPLNGERSEVLSAIMPAEAARALSRALGGRTLTLPKLDKLMIQVRNRRIRAEAAAGASLACLARRYDLTTRQISNILAADACTEEDQLDLFNLS